MAAWIGAGIAAGGIIGGWIGSHGAQSAANTQAGAIEQAAQTQMQMFNTIQGQEQPFMQTGYDANQTLAQLMGIGGGYSGRTSAGAPTQPTVANPINVGSTAAPAGTYQGGGEFAHVPGGTVTPNAGTPTIQPRTGAAMPGIEPGTPPRPIGGGQAGLSAQTLNSLEEQARTQAEGAPNILHENWQTIYQKLVASAQSAQRAPTPAIQAATPAMPAIAPGTQPMGPNGTVGGTGLQPGYLTQTFNPTMDQLQNYPGYQFAQQTGQQAVRNADTPGMGALSGSALKDLTNFASGTAANYYNQYFNQFQAQQGNIYNRLMGMTQVGQNAAANLGTQGATLGTGVAQAEAQAGAASAAGQVGSANAWGGAVSGIPMQMMMGQYLNTH